MDPEKLKAALEALKNGDGDAALAILEELLTSAAAGDAAGEGDAAGDGGDDGAGALAESPDDKPDDEEDQQYGALGKRLMALTGRPSVAEAWGDLEGMTQRIRDFDKERAAAEQADRLELVGELVKLGVELPATAWEGDPKDRKPVKRLADESIAGLRARVTAFRKARPARLHAVEPPPSGDDLTDEVSKLSRSDLDACKKRGMSPEEFIRAKRDAARRHGRRIA